ncbi:hypothetical protein NQZ68_016886 [Dissostichus eleginoides]|nr:hypothetical protein NQZ68_016886 [Dissostichus eleginoides]
MWERLGENESLENHSSCRGHLLLQCYEEAEEDGEMSETITTREFAELLEKYGSNGSTGSTRNSPIQQATLTCQKFPQTSEGRSGGADGAGPRPPLYSAARHMAPDQAEIQSDPKTNHAAQEPGQKQAQTVVSASSVLHVVLWGGSSSVLHLVLWGGQ